MLDLINRLKSVKAAEEPKKEKKSLPNCGVPLRKIIQERYRSRKIGKQCVSEWKDFEVFWQWFEQQPKPNCRTWLLVTAPRLSEKTCWGPDTTALMSTTLYGVLIEKGLKDPEPGIPYGVRVVGSRNTPMYCYSRAARQGNSQTYKDPLECHFEWLRNRIAYLNTFKAIHNDCPRISLIIDHCCSVLQECIDTNTAYHRNQWRL